MTAPFLVSSQFAQDGNNIYYDLTSATASGIEIKADGTNLVTFDLDDMTFSPYSADQTVSITITATLSGGGTATQSVSDFAMALGNSYSTTGDMGMDFSAFDDVETLTFDITTASYVYNVNFNTISVSDEQTMVVGTTPTVQTSDLAKAREGTSYLDLYWQNGDGARRAVFVLAGTAGTPPVSDGSTYSADADFNAAGDIGGGWRCVYNGLNNYVAISGLSAGTDYRVVVYEYNGTGGGEAYLTTTGGNVLNVATETASTAQTYDFSSLGTAADGFKPQGSRFLVSDTFTQDDTAMYYYDASETVSGIVIKADGTNLVSFDLGDMEFRPYATDKTLSLTITATLDGGGTATQTISGFVMVHGVGYSLTAMGMDLSAFDDVTELQLDVTVLGDSVQNVTFDNITIDDQMAGFASGTTPTTQATDIQVARKDTTTMEIYWQNGDGSRRVVFFKAGDSGQPTLVDGTTYTAGSSFSSAADIGDGWRCVFNGNGNYTEVTGLTADTQYRMAVFEFDGSGGGEAYLTTIATNIANAATPATGTAVTYDFSLLGSAAGGYKPQGGRFLISDGFKQDGTGIYFDSTDESVSGLEILADNTHLASFDLKDLVISAFQADRTISLTVTAQLSGGGSTFQSVTDFPLVLGPKFSLALMGMDFSAFDDVTEISMDLTVTGSAVGNVVFETITLDDAQTPPSPPAAATQAVSGIGITSATANGSLSDLGNPSATAHGFVWNTTGTPTLSDQTVNLGAPTATGSYSSSLTGLSAYTTYYVRSFATNTEGTDYGDEVSFTTLAQPATVTTQAVSDINTTGATANGTISDPGDPSATAHGFVWNTAGTPTLADSSVDLGAAASTGSYSGSLTGLSAYTTYYVRAFATNADGTVYGGAVSFTTSSQAATVTTQAVSGIGTTGATANGTITDPGDPSATAHGFVWNTTGTPTLSDSSVDLGAAASTGSYSGSLTGLSAYTTYYVRAFATNADGTVYGGAVSFTTSSQAATVTTQAVSGIGTTGATANGTLSDPGAPSATAHGFVWNTTGTPTLSDSSVDLGAAASTGSYSGSLTGLSAYTTYYVRAFATNANGTVYGDAVSFTTSSQAATVTTQAASGIGTTSATANGTISGLGVPSATAHGFVWNTTGAPTLSDSSVDLGAAASTGSYTGSLTGLSVYTTYYVRAYATNIAGTVYGDQVNFTTFAQSATVTTQAADGIGATSATGHGTISGLGVPSAVAHGFVWNTTGTPTLADSSIDLGAAAATGAYTGSLTGLSAYTTYYMRAYATNAAGTVYGDTVSFTTSARSAAVTTQAVDGISTTSAAAHGTIADPGVPSATAHGFVWNTTGTPTLSDQSVDLGAATATGSYTGSLTGLSVYTTYYVRAYATSVTGTVYGDTVTFITGITPVADAGPDQTATTDDLVTLDGGNSTDADGDIIQWEWAQLEGPTVQLTDADTATPSFNAPDTGDDSEAVLVFRLVVTDADGLTSEDTCRVTVSPAINTGGGGGGGGGSGCFISSVF